MLLDAGLGGQGQGAGGERGATPGGGHMSTVFRVFREMAIS